jgi:hypothetical protein
MTLRRHRTDYGFRAFERMKKSKWRRNFRLVMAVLDTAIQKKPR